METPTTSPAANWRQPEDCHGQVEPSGAHAVEGMAFAAGTRIRGRKQIELHCRGGASGAKPFQFERLASALFARSLVGRFSAARITDGAAAGGKDVEQTGRKHARRGLATQ